MGKKLSIKEIAELAGFSVATVSRVINKNGGYSPETEKRVLSVIKRYNYTPNLVAKGLRTNKTPIVGIIIPDIVNEFYSKLVLHLQMVLFESGYLTTICNTNESRDLEYQHLQALLAQNVSGLILISGSSYNNMAESLSIPTVYIDRRPMEKSNDIIYVESDNVQGGYLATKELIDCGCRRIGFVTDMLTESSKTSRYQGYCKALQEADIAIEPSFIFRVENVKIEDAFSVITQAFSQGMPLDGIMCTTDMLAVGALMAAKEAGFKIPENMKITGFDDITAASIISPGITTVHQYSNQMAQIVSQLLTDLFSGKKPEKTEYTIPVSLIKRESTG